MKFRGDDGMEELCGYNVRLQSKWAKHGAICPIHKEPMEVIYPETDSDDSPDSEPASVAAGA